MCIIYQRVLLCVPSILLQPGATNIKTMAWPLDNVINQNGGPKVLCFSGGAGAGLGVASSNCQFGANFGVNVAVPLIGGGPRADEPVLNANVYCDSNPDNGSGQIYTQITNLCNSECGYNNYQLCWCPCEYPTHVQAHS